MSEMTYNEWLQPRLVARIWWCGDDYCDDTQPIIERITPNERMGYPWIRRETIWSGTMRDRASFEERDEQIAELQEACKEYGIPMPEDLLEEITNRN